MKNGQLFDLWLADPLFHQDNIPADLLKIFESFVDGKHADRKSIYATHPEAFEGSVDVLQIVH